MLLALQLGRVTEAHAPCVAAAAKALQELVGLRLQVQQLAQDRVQAANNIRIAEKEVGAEMTVYSLVLSPDSLPVNIVE